MQAACLWIGVVLTAGGPRDQYPPRLRGILDQEVPTTVQVEWSVTWLGGDNDGLVERYVTRKAGDTLWESNLGDENGYHRLRFRVLEPQGASPEEPRVVAIPTDEDAGTDNRLIHEGKAWDLKAERPDLGFVASLDTPDISYIPVNLPAVGLALTPDQGRFGLASDALEGFDSAVFREGNEGGFPTVDAEWNGGGCRLSWRFDDRVGGQPVQASWYLGGVLVLYSESDYEKVGDRWFPKSVRFYQGDSATPYRMIHVERATFDEPWHRQEITPNDIGALYGTQFVGPTGYQMWTGVDLIPDHEFWDLVEVFDIPPDPRIVELLAAPHQTADQLRDFWRGRMVWRREEYRKKYGDGPWLVKMSAKEKDEWDVYVEKFLAEHKLPEPAAKKAPEILKRAKDLRDARRRQNAAVIREAKEAGDEKKVEHFEALEKRIFDRMLVRNLKKLLPEKAEAKASTTTLP